MSDEPRAEEVLALYDRGMKRSEIAKTLSISEMAVLRVLLIDAEWTEAERHLLDDE